MRKFVVVAVAALITATLAVGTVAGAGNLWKAPPFSSIGINTVVLDPNVDYREEGSGGSLLSIFVETGSSSNACLATLNELWWVSVPGIERPDVGPLFCAVRNPTFDGVKLHGVYLHVFFSGDVGEGLNLLVNVYQEGAKYYRAPVYCGINCGG